MVKNKNTQQKHSFFGLGAVWGVLTRNGIMKILCILLAFAVWQVIRESTSHEVVVADIPVTIHVGAGRAVLDQSSDVVSIRFRGSREEVRFISRDQVAVELDLSARPDRMRQSFKLAPRYVQAPSQAHAVDFEPAEITVTMDREVERALPVKASLTGKLPDGVQLEKAVCTPAAVQVRGAERLLRDLELIHTVSIPLNDRHDTFKTRADIAAEDQPWTVSPERVSVEAVLVKRVATRQLKSISVRALLDSENLRWAHIKPSKVTITLHGSPERVDSLKPREIYAYVDCSELTEPTEYEVPVRVDVPAGVTIEKIEPASVLVDVKNM